MSKSDFVEAIKEMIKKEMGKDYEVMIHKTDIVNAPNEISLCMRKRGQDIGVSVRISKFYQGYQDDELSMDMVCDKIKEVYFEGEKEKPAVPMLNQITDYEKMKEFLHIRLVNRQQNKELLEGIPHEEYLDLVVVFCLLVKKEMNSIGSITVTNKIMAEWNISLEVLLRDALENGSRLLPAKITPLSDILLQLSGGVFLPDDFQEERAMYVLTNHMGINGASALLYPEVLENFYQKCNCDFYILPSSIHEVILLPSSDAVNPELLRNMVQEVNQTIAEGEILSNHVYLFGKEHELELIA